MIQLCVKSEYQLRRVEQSDRDQILCWRNQPHVREAMYTDHIISTEEHKTWFENILQSSDAVHLILEERNTPVAVINFTCIDRFNGRCYWGFYLNTPSPKKGTGSVMAWFSMEWCFSNLAMRKVCCESFSFNTRARSLYQKFGFTQEACFRSHVFKNGTYHDVLGFGLLEPEWMSHREQICKSLFRKPI